MFLSYSKEVTIHLAIKPQSWPNMWLFATFKAILARKYSYLENIRMFILFFEMLFLTTCLEKSLLKIYDHSYPKLLGRYVFYGSKSTEMTQIRPFILTLKRKYSRPRIIYCFIMSCFFMFILIQATFNWHFGWSLELFETTKTFYKEWLFNKMTNQGADWSKRVNNIELCLFMWSINYKICKIKLNNTAFFIYKRDQLRFYVRIDDFFFFCKNLIWVHYSSIFLISSHQELSECLLMFASFGSKFL